MASRPQLMQIPMGLGIDGSKPPTLTDPGHMVELENAEIDKAGSIQVRSGYEAMTEDCEPSGSFFCSDIATHDEQLLAAGTHYLNVYGYGTDTWLPADNFPEMQISRVWEGEKGIVETATGLLYPSGDAITCGNYVCESWVVGNFVAWSAESGGYTVGGHIYSRVIDRTSGLRSPRRTHVARGPNVRLARIGAKIYAVWQSDARELSVDVFDTTAPSAWWTASAVVSDMDKAHPVWDVHSIDDGANDALLIAYNRSLAE